MKRREFIAALSGTAGEADTEQISRLDDWRPYRRMNSARARDRA
jgi:hypothetical protein